MEINKIYNENCLETLSRMPDNFLDLVVTSPPYDSLREYTNEACWNFDVFQKIAKELYRVIKEGGCVVWVVGDATVNGSETGTSFKQALYFKECGFRLHDTMIYHKYSPPLTHNRYEQHFEFMFVFSKDTPITFNPLMDKKLYKDNRTHTNIRREKDGSSDMGFSSKKENKIRGNVWKYNIGGGHVTADKIAYSHPAIFPESLAKDHILSWSNEGNLIYDPFGGSGTTCKMAKLLNRNWIMSEISEKYCNIAKDRIFNHHFLGKDTNKNTMKTKGFFK